jgi:Mor family transcriptional regulator
MLTDTIDTPAAAPSDPAAPVAATTAEESRIAQDHPTLCADIESVIHEALRDKTVSDYFRQDLNEIRRRHLASWVSIRVAMKIGGRYIPKKVDDRAARNAAVVQAFTGNNHADLMRDFRISRRLVYNIVARVRRG